MPFRAPNGTPQPTGAIPWPPPPPRCDEGEEADRAGLAAGDTPSCGTPAGRGGGEVRLGFGFNDSSGLLSSHFPGPGPLEENASDSTGLLRRNSFCNHLKYGAFSTPR